MKAIDTNKIIRRLSAELESKRYKHSLGVAYTATSLAMRHDEDITKAEIAGLLHDCAKCYDDKKLFKLAQKWGIEITEAEEKSKFLLHAKVGAYMAASEYGVDDPEVLESIKYHTTGKPDMNKLEKIIYIADYIEPGRTKQKRLGEIRKVSFENLDEAMLMILEDVLEYLRSTNSDIDEMTEKTYDYYRSLIKA